MMTVDEREELEQLRKSAYLFVSDPGDRAFFALDSLLAKAFSPQFDSVMRVDSFRILATAVIELRREIKESRVSLKELFNDLFEAYAKKQKESEPKKEGNDECVVKQQENS